MADVLVGQDLQEPQTVTLSDTVAPTGGLTVLVAPTVDLEGSTSSTGPLVLLSDNPVEEGEPSLSVTIPAGETTSPTFYVQAVGDTGTVDFTATAPSSQDLAPAHATFTVSPSAFLWEDEAVIEVVKGQDRELKIRSYGIASGHPGGKKIQPVRGRDGTKDVPIHVESRGAPGNRLQEALAKFEPNTSVATVTFEARTDDPLECIPPSESSRKCEAPGGGPPPGGPPGGGPPDHAAAHVVLTILHPNGNWLGINVTQ